MTDAIDAIDDPDDPDECDRCGAMLPPADVDGLRTCAYCGATTDITPPSADPGPMASPVPVIEPVAPPDDVVIASARPASRGGCGVWALVIIVALVGVVPIGAALLGSNVLDDIGLPDSLTGGGVDLDISGETALLLPSEPTAPMDLVVLTYHYDQGLAESVHEVARFDGDHEPMWRGPALSETAYQVPLLSDGTRIFTTDDDQVQALAMADGTEQWRNALTDTFSWTCEHCFSLVGDRLLVTSSDGVLQAFDTATGQQAWSRRLDDTRAPTYVVGDRILLIDGAGGDHRGLVLNPDDGAELTTLSPGCRRPDSPGSMAGTIDSDSQVVPMADGTVVLGFGTWPGCWERRDLSGAPPTWQTVLPESSFSSDVAVVHDDTTLMAQDSNGSLVVVDLTTGAAWARPADIDTTLLPLAVTADTYVVLSRSDRGSRPWSVLALDPATGDARWSWELGDATPAFDTFGAGTIVSSNDQQVAMHVANGGVDLITVDGDTSDLTVGRLDLTTGAPDPDHVIDMPDDVGALRFVPIGWRGRQAAVLVSDAVVVVDLATGTVADRYGG